MLQDVLQNYSPLAGARLEIESVSGGFSGAGIWRVRRHETDIRHGDAFAAQSMEFALRRWPADAPSVARIYGLHRLLRFVADSQVTTVAAPLSTSDGQTLLQYGGQLWQLEPWMPGRSDFHDRPTAARLAAAMTSLADWHRAASRFQPDPAAARWFTSRPSAPSPAVTQRLERTQYWLEGALQRAREAVRAEAHRALADLAAELLSMATMALPLIRDELQAVQSRAVRLQPCLRDVHGDHILFEDDRVSGIIDPAACRSECVATDLARLLGSLLGDDRQRWQQAIEVYSACCRLSPAEQELIGVLDRSAVVLSPLTWLRRRYVQPVVMDVDRVLPRLQQQAVRLSGLLQRDSS